MNVPNEKILEEVRALMPRRPMGLGEARYVAECQAKLLLKLLRVKDMPVDIFRFTEIPGVSIEMRPRYLMGNVPAFTLSKKDDTHRIVVTQNEPLTRRRYHLAHEIKHVLDFRLAEHVYTSLAVGNKDIRQDLIERKICDHFAANFLMPRHVLRRVWDNGIQHPEALAELFNVSMSAMIRHLRDWGFTNEPARPASDYFQVHHDVPVEQPPEAEEEPKLRMLGRLMPQLGMA